MNRTEKIAVAASITLFGGWMIPMYLLTIFMGFKGRLWSGGPDAFEIGISICGLALAVIVTAPWNIRAIARGLGILALIAFVLVKGETFPMWVWVVGLMAVSAWIAYRKGLEDGQATKQSTGLSIHDAR
jgi:hypothetical protein